MHDCTCKQAAQTYASGHTADPHNKGNVVFRRPNIQVTPSTDLELWDRHFKRFVCYLSWWVRHCQCHCDIGVLQRPAGVRAHCNAQFPFHIYKLQRWKSLEIVSKGEICTPLLPIAIHLEGEVTDNTGHLEILSKWKTNMNIPV